MVIKTLCYGTQGKINLETFERNAHYENPCPQTGDMYWLPRL